MNNKKQRGRGDPRNVWGGSSDNNTKDKSSEESASPINFADSNSFGPPLGQRARPNRAQKTSNAPPAGTTSQAQVPSAWGKSAPTVVAQTAPSKSNVVDLAPKQPSSVPQAQAQVASAWGKPAPAIQHHGAQSTPPKPNVVDLAPKQPSSVPQAQAQVPSAWGKAAPAIQHHAAQTAQSKPNVVDLVILAPEQPNARASSVPQGTPHFPTTNRNANVSSGTRGRIQDDRTNRNFDLDKTRPETLQSKRGTTGKLVAVTSNYFALNATTKWEIYQYHINFLPEVENPSFRNNLLVRHRTILGAFLYDRGSNIFTLQKLQNDLIEISTRDRDDKEILIKIKRVALVSTLEHRFISILNIIMKKAMKELELQRVSRDYFDPKAKIEIREHRIELWPGYTTSIRQHESKLLMLAEVKHKLMRDETVLEILNQCYRENRTGYREHFCNQVIGLVVFTRYNKNKTYRISDVLFDQSPEHTFESKTGPLSYIDYYRVKHGITIKDTRQPLLVSIPTEKDIRGASDRNEVAQQINLIPELCSPTGYTDAMRRNFHLMQNVARYTRVGPADRIQKLLAFNRRLQTTERSVQCFRDWSLTLSDKLVEIPNARELPAEMIQLGNGKNVEARNADWTNALQGRNSMFSSESLPNNQWVFVMPKFIEKDVRDFLNVLMTVSKGMNFDVGNPRIVVVENDRSTTLSTALQQQCNMNPKMIVVAISKNVTEVYSTIKKVCCIQYCVPSQVVTHRIMDVRKVNVSKMRSVATKVAIQMNTKLGGLPWNVNIPLKYCMFIGFDVCHDTKDKSRSFGALVATIDLKNEKNSSKFFSSVHPHKNGEELSNFLTISVINALKHYYQVHNNYPDRIMFYRDGVGEGQTSFVYNHELTHLRNSLRQFLNYDPKLGFVIVSKRINTKFFLGNPSGARNVNAGTVVDDVVTMPERYDFFLVAQAVNQGTATPTSYNVIHDTFGIGPDKLQILTWKMCHLYYNWSGTTRVPAVCQYAHKLAFMVGNYLHQSPHAGLNSFLYFL